MKHSFHNISFLFFVTLILFSCGSAKNNTAKSTAANSKISKRLDSKTKNEAFKNSFGKNNYTGAENINAYVSLLKDKKIGIVTNQTGSVQKLKIVQPNSKDSGGWYESQQSIVDLFMELELNVQSIFAPEHGFRGTADAGETIVDGKDTKTGLPIISLYGENKKPKPEQLAGIDVLVFDLQDVGARFYTYISSLHYVMEACAENNIPLIVLDRPNPNGSIVDGPILEKEFTSFIGMHAVPILHGMTIGEYAKMINGEKWLKNELHCDLKIIPCLNYKRTMSYSLPIKPSPNLPNDQAINLYASLCLFEGTNVSSGRGTDKQFQIYGSPFLPVSNFSFTPVPNAGSKEPMNKNVLCYGEDLSEIEKVEQLELKWIIKAYATTSDKSKFFIPFFTKLAGNKKLQEQIESGMSEEDIRKSWEKGLQEFLKIRKKYLIYP